MKINFFNFNLGRMVQVDLPSWCKPKDKFKLTMLSGQVYLSHPDRAPHIYNQVTKKWKKLTSKVNKGA